MRRIVVSLVIAATAIVVPVAPASAASRRHTVDLLRVSGKPCPSPFACFGAATGKSLGPGHLNATFRLTNNSDGGCHFGGTWSLTDRRGSIRGGWVGEYCGGHHLMTMPINSSTGAYRGVRGHAKLTRNVVTRALSLATPGEVWRLDLQMG